MRTVLVCGGGTGGHLYPALALLEGLRRAEPSLRLIYVGSRYGLETKVMPRHPWVEFHTLPIRGVARPGQRPFWFFWALCALAQLPVALFHAFRIVLTVRPSVIIGVGGYAAFAPLLWGVFLKIPIFLHEQNLFPGMVTRLFAPWAKEVFLTYPQTARWLKARHLVVTGLPVRPEILSAKPDPERFGLQPGVKTVLVVGGSRGSQTLTETVLAARHLCPKVQFLVVTGDLTIQQSPPTLGERPRERCAPIVLVPYVHEMGTALATADVVICRAGAATLAELAALHKKAIIVPWPLSAGDHQTANARQLARLGVFSLLPEFELTPQRLVEEITTALRHATPPSSPSGAGDAQPAALNHILHEVFLNATSANSTTALYRNRWRRHERVGQSLF